MPENKDRSEQAGSGINRRRFMGTSVGGAAAGAFAFPDVSSSTTTAPAAEQTANLVELTHGVAVGDVTAETAALWARTDGPATVRAEYMTEDSETSERSDSAETTAETDHIAQIRLTGLESASRYHYRVWATDSDSEGTEPPPSEAMTEGLFITAPASDERAPVRFAWGGDGYDNEADPPFPLVDKVAEFRPDFFVYNGDTIYADSPIPAVPDAPADELSELRAKHREMRSTETHLQNLLAVTSVYANWDDHEVANNFAGPTEPLMPTGRQAFMEYWPIDDHSSVTGSDPNRMYRKFQWGKNLELFILDTRQYRDPNEAPDGPDKTLLGEEQKKWLLESLEGSEATFKLIVNSFPLSFTGSADGWPDMQGKGGFENELGEIIDLVLAKVENVLWLSGDCHHGQVASYDPDEDGDVDFYEVAVGPLGGREDTPDHPLDPTFNPTNVYAEGGFHNFGTVFIDEPGETLYFDIRDDSGALHYSKTIEAQ
jgi:alkaline phosphatase D